MRNLTYVRQRHKAIYVLLSIYLSGCALPPPMPLSVAMLPNDCANQKAITEWLEQVGRDSKSIFETKSEYQERIANVKSRLWEFRTVCNQTHSLNTQVRTYK